MAGGQGCIVIREDGNSIEWRKKCERCGFVDGNIQRSSKLSSGQYTAGFYCPKCREQQEIRIYF